MNTKKIESQLSKNGYVQLSLDKSSLLIIENLKKELLNRLRDKWNINLKMLELYHLTVIDDDLNIEIQKDLTQVVIKDGAIRRIIHNELEIFKALVGVDLHIQKYPYLRIARPNKTQDNIGYHRDTHYGSSPYEVSIHIPLTSVGKLGSLCYYPRFSFIR